MKHGAEITAVLNVLSFVRWDRFVEAPWAGVTWVRVYGWIEREDEHEDFVVMDFVDFDGELEYRSVTSSDHYSAVINEALFGATGAHFDCERVEEGLPGVGRAIRLGDEPE